MLEVFRNWFKHSTVVKKEDKPSLCRRIELLENLARIQQAQIDTLLIKVRILEVECLNLESEPTSDKA